MYATTNSAKIYIEYTVNKNVRKYIIADCFSFDYFNDIKKYFNGEWMYEKYLF